jgi:hypothetical protein
LFRHDPLKHFLESGHPVESLVRTTAVLGLPERRNPGGFFDDDQVLVDVSNANVPLGRRSGAGLLKHFYDVAGFQATLFVDGQVPVQLDVALSDQPPHLRGTLPV